jgi:tetratricopeptide (TPR) repeat protein
MHYSQFYQEQGQKEEAGQLWSEWAELVSPLDEGPEWQGNVHYNAACSLALAGDAQGALLELRKGLELRPSSKAWSRQDSDLDILHDLPEYKELYAPAYWWEALEANAQAEAVADQFLRTLSMLRIAVSTFPESEWRVGESLYQRPASLALHIVQSIDFYSALKPGDSSEDQLTQINWEERNSSKLPSQVELLGFLDKVEERLAKFITKSDFQAEEKLFLWTGFTVLSRAMYNLRHTQHHLADMAMELQRRGLTPPDWQ